MKNLVKFLAMIALAGAMTLLFAALCLSGLRISFPRLGSHPYIPTFNLPLPQNPGHCT
jgi:hypothetical protein